MKTNSEKIQLSKHTIIETALTLIAEKGIDAFSIRDVSRQLKVYPTAIYWYFKNKNTLLGEVANAVMSKVTPDYDSIEWQEWLRMLFGNYREAVKQHPNIAQLIGSRLLANAYQDPALLEGVITALIEAGCPQQHIIPMYNTVIAAMCGFATMEFGTLPQDNIDEWKAHLKDGANTLEPSVYPNLSHFLPHMLNTSFILRWQNGYDKPMNDSFTVYVDVFLDGLQSQIKVMNQASI